MSRFEVTIPQAFVFSFAEQVRQYPLVGMPGISYFRGTINEHIYVNCLLWRDEYGIIQGILNHYPMGNSWERAGNVNVFIDPDHKRQGIGTALVAECVARWGEINADQQRYTPEGAAFAARLMDGAHRGGALNRKE